MTTDQSQTARATVRIQDLNLRQHSLVELMRENQFGRIEHMPIRGGQPILDSTVNVVRVARLGGDSLATKSITGDDFELKRQVRNLFEELERLQDGTVIRLEFRHGLPFLLETAPSAVVVPECLQRDLQDQNAKAVSD
jgi:hypothetical protein